MSDSKLNMSLDDLIAKAKKQPGTSKSRGGGSAGKKGVRVGTRAPLKVVGSKAPPRGKTATGSKPAIGRQSVSVNLSSVRRGGVLKRGGPTRVRTIASPAWATACRHHLMVSGAAAS